MTTLTASPARQLITRRLAEYAVNLGFTDLPAATVEKTKQAILDLLGIAIRASIAGESSDVVRGVVDSLGALGARPGSESVRAISRTMRRY